MGAQGTATIDFGTGALEATVVVTGQAAILSNSLVEAWPALTATANNPVDSAKEEEFQVSAGDIVAGTGFTIYARALIGKAFGLYNMNWVWN